MRRHACIAGALLAILVTLAAPRPSAQMRHMASQNVAPVFEGWQRNADGSFDLIFGYMNRNYEEQPELPLGPDNNIEPGGPDHGQPTHFYPRRQQFVFRVRVPKDFGKRELVWTLTRNGQTAKAYGTLKDDEELTPVIISQNRAGLASDEETAAPNKPPAVTIDGAGQRTIGVGEPLPLAASVSDDGVPKPRVPAAAAPAAARPDRPPRPVSEGPGSQAIVRPNRQGLAITWVNYRGPGLVRFDPMSVLVRGGQAATKATFAQPGTYTLRAYADDGVLTTSADVVVTVTARK